MIVPYNAQYDEHGAIVSVGGTHGHPLMRVGDVLLDFATADGKTHDTLTITGFELQERKPGSRTRVGPCIVVSKGEIKPEWRISYTMLRMEIREGYVEHRKAQ